MPLYSTVRNVICSYPADMLLPVCLYVVAMKCEALQCENDRLRAENQRFRRAFENSWVPRLDCFGWSWTRDQLDVQEITILTWRHAAVSQTAVKLQIISQISFISSLNIAGSVWSSSFSTYRCRRGLVVNALASINIVIWHWTWLLLGWVTVCWQVNHLGVQLST